ncbi:hypothetical protein Pmani_002186 [Petrolisthes manimaculis]|uniref:Uncharacterized protein n=1 Tax=Petrolisthes manimaculis TaxID=1843537 RepID=A0AAE1QKW0_9EUCA|nr:hypothetical protein Pmani_002186 [Petrolisthes manimaculis]
MPRVQTETAQYSLVTHISLLPLHISLFVFLASHHFTIMNFNKTTTLYCYVTPSQDDVTTDVTIRCYVTTDVTPSQDDVTTDVSISCYVTPSQDDVTADVTIGCYVTTDVTIRCYVTPSQDDVTTDVTKILRYCYVTIHH